MSTTLYRFFDQGDRLLYVGISSNPGRRFHQHGKDKDWWGQVARSTMEHHPSRLAALEAERTAITREHPLHNVVHNTHRTCAPPPDELRRPTVSGGMHDFRHDKDCLGTGPQYFKTRWGQCRHDDLYLQPEPHLSPCVDDVYGESEDPSEQGRLEVEYWFDYLRSRNGGCLPTTVSVYWSIGGRQTCETAPLGHLWGNRYQDLGDFLTHFSWPIDAGTDEPINFLRLPIVHRFGRFAKALGYQPSPLQPTYPVAHLEGSGRLAALSKGTG